MPRPPRRSTATGRGWRTPSIASPTCAAYGWSSASESEPAAAAPTLQASPPTSPGADPAGSLHPPGRRALRGSNVISRHNTDKVARVQLLFASDRGWQVTGHVATVKHLSPLAK